jgi:hypothetical protein
VLNEEEFGKIAGRGAPQQNTRSLKNRKQRGQTHGDPKVCPVRPKAIGKQQKGERDRKQRC